MTVKLEVLNKTHLDDLKEFYLSEEQNEFTMLPIQKIDVLKDSESAVQLVLVNGEKVVGYFALEDGEKLRRYSSNETAKLLTSFSIDTRHQGKGYAKQGLSQLPAFLKANFPHINEIVLGVNKRNVAAKGLYEKVGFVDNGEILIGSKGLQHIMHMDIRC